MNRQEKIAAMNSQISRAEKIQAMSGQQVEQPSSSKWPINHARYLNQDAPLHQTSTADADFPSPLDRATAKGPESVAKLAKYRDMPAWQRAAISAALEVEDIATGTSDVLDFAGHLLNLQGLSDNLRAPKGSVAAKFQDKLMGNRDIHTRRAERRAKQDQRNIDLEEYRDAEGMAGTIGKMLPALAFERFGGPAFRKGAQAVLNKSDDVVRSVGNRISKESNLSKVVGKDKAKQFHEWKRNYAAQPKLGAGEQTGVAADIIGGAGLGALEGTLNYDHTALGDGIGALAGGIAGHTILRPLSKKINSNTPSDRALLKRLPGVRVSPGVQLQNNQLLDIERGMRNDFDTHAGDYMQRYDAANQEALNTIAYKSMGFGDKTSSNMTMDDYASMFRQAGEEYDNLVAGTHGRFDGKQWTEFVNDAKKVSDEGNIDVSNDIAQVMKNIQRGNTQNGRNSLGQVKPWTFKGETFQAERIRLRDKIAKYSAAGDKESAKALRPIVTHLDDAIDRGMKVDGTVSAKDWKKANEQFAMRSILTTHGGMDLRGNVNPEGLHRYFQDDVERAVSSNKGEIRKLHDIAQYYELTNPVMRSSQKQFRLNDSILPPKRSLAQKLLFNKVIGLPSALQNMSMGTYMTGYPVETGFLGMNRTGMWSPSALSRATNQAVGQYPWMADQAGNAINSSSKLIDEGKNIIERGYTSLEQMLGKDEADQKGQPQ